MELEQTKTNNKNNLINNRLDTSSIQETLRSLELMREQSMNSIQAISKSIESMRSPYIESMQELRKTIEKMTKLYYSSTLQNSLSELSKTMNLYNRLEIGFEDEEERNYLQPTHNEEIVSYVNEVSDILQDESISIIERIDKIIKKYVYYIKMQKIFLAHIQLRMILQRKAYLF